MSILNDQTSNEQQPAQIAAQKLIQITKQTYQQMVNAFNQGSQIFWNDGNGATSEQIAAELGNNAKEIFELHYKLGQLIGSVQPESIQEGVSLIGQFTMNEDGTITVLSE